MHVMQLETRIKKLEKEESKAKRRIGDAKRKQEFLKSIKMDKVQKINDK